MCVAHFTDREAARLLLNMEQIDFILWDEGPHVHCYSITSHSVQSRWLRCFGIPTQSSDILCFSTWWYLSSVLAETSRFFIQIVKKRIEGQLLNFAMKALLQVVIKTSAYSHISLHENSCFACSHISYHVHKDMLRGLVEIHLYNSLLGNEVGLTWPIFGSSPYLHPRDQYFLIYMLTNDA